MIIRQNQKETSKNFISEQCWGATRSSTIDKIEDQNHFPGQSSLKTIFEPERVELKNPLGIAQIKQSSLVGLSNVPNLTAKISVKTFITGEGQISVYPSYRKNKNAPPPPPREAGLLIQEGLTNRAKNKIQLAARCLQTLSTTCSFITLSYGKDYPDDHESKIHLDNFFKRIRRFKEKNGGEFRFLWVAEKQKRGAIHYHILSSDYVPKDIINACWNGITSKWQRNNGHLNQRVLPNVIGVKNAGGYLAKYLSKEGHKIGGNMYSMCKKTRELIKPEHTYFYAKLNNVNEMVMDAALMVSDNIEVRMWEDRTGFVGVWISDVKQIFKHLEILEPEYEPDKMKETITFTDNRPGKLPYFNRT